MSQVIIHHDNNLLIWDAVLVDYLVGMAHVSLKGRVISRSTLSLTGKNSGNMFCEREVSYLRVKPILSETKAFKRQKQPRSSFQLIRFTLLVPSITSLTWCL